jgi:aryl-alcohol dehydrogenase-like predicted oxidoreductase
MQNRPLGKTGIQLPIISFGASSLGAEFRSITLDEAMQSTRVALELGMNFIDTSPFYGRGMSEILLGMGLQDVPRDSYLLGTKLGRYSDIHFDFSAKRVEESVHVSLQRLKTDHLDVLLLHDVEFVSLPQIWEETLPALLKIKEQGKARAIGFSCYPLKTFHTVLDHIEDHIDCILAYNRYTLQNTTLATDLLPRLKAKGIGVIGAGPFSARLLTQAALPAWLKEPEEVKAAAREAARVCAARGVDIAQLSLQFACSHPDISTSVAGSANPDNIRKWADWIEQPIDEELLSEVLAIFEPVKDIGHTEGLPENN